MTVLRPYQVEAVESALREFKEVSSTLLAMPTGTGKTLTACELIRRQQGRTMWLTHRDELVHQSAAAIEKSLGEYPEIEKAERKASQSGFSNCVVATVQTLISGKNGDRRMTKFSPHDFDLLVLDEAHRSVSDSWRTVVDYFRQNKDLKILGLTATPKRSDEEALGQIFESVAFEYPILQAIHDGYLVPVQQQVVKVEGLDFSHIKTTAGDLNLGELAREMEREKNPMEIAGSTIEIIGNRRSIVFTVSVVQAEMTAEIYNRYKPGCAAFLYQGTPKDARRKIMHQFANGDIQILVNVLIVSEGVDVPAAEVCVMARPTKSLLLYQQCAGRVLRPLANCIYGLETTESRRFAISQSAKPSALIIDLAGNAGKHHLINSGDLLGGHYSDEVRELALRKATDSQKPTDIERMLADAQFELRQKEKDLEAARRAKLTARVKYHSWSVDPFNAFSIVPRTVSNVEHGRSLSEKQRKLLERQGVDPDQYNYAQAKQLIDNFFYRWQHHLASYKQAGILKRFGIDAHEMSREQATHEIDAIAARGWKR